MAMLTSTRNTRGRTRSARSARKGTPAAAPAAPTSPTPQSRGRAKAPRKEKLSFSPTDEDITPEVMEFIEAIGHYKRENNRPFPTWSEVLKVLKGLGYKKG